ncbi:MAG: NADH-quinone oxidoreductase subunit L [Acidobacteriota bacterium]
MIDLFWLIPLIPIAGVLINGLLGRRFLNERVVAVVACGTIFLSFVLSAGAFLGLAQLVPEQRHQEIVLYDWIPAGVAHLSGSPAAPDSAPFIVRFGFLLDPLSAVMILVVTGVGFLIHVYSIGYMHGDKGFYRFFTYLNLFAAFMLVLVLGNSYGMMFIGWEGVGLCSYLLIGYYFSKKSAGDAGKKAFIVNRVGDLGFLLGMLTIFFTFGSLDYSKVFVAAHNFDVGAPVITAITLLLFIGAIGKSAQIPLYTWLPDAMEGPTPVSALIHAATMVTAGVYMVARSNVLYSLAPLSMTVVAAVGGITALYAASIALVQNDIKRVLAYSTISQLGYMFLACGVGAYAAGIFHLVTHAFFKALLFLGAGSVMHALSGELDMWKMGNVKKYMPITYWTFLVGTLAIAGIPGLAGFFSKDEILWMAWAGPNGHPLLWALGALAAGLTAFYMFRMVFVTFHGSSRMDPHVEEHAHESPLSITIPLTALASLAVVGGYIGIPAVLRVGPLASLHEAGNIFEWLAPVLGGESHAALMEHGSDGLLASLQPGLLQEAESAAGTIHSAGLEFGLMAVSVLIALAGVALAYAIYIRQPGLADRLAERMSGAYRTLFNKYYIDELYDALFVNRAKDLGDGLWIFDDAVVDGIVNGVADSTVRAATAGGNFDNQVVDGAVNAVANDLQRTSRLFRTWQTGFVQNYVLIIVLGIFFLVSAYLFF